MCSGNKNSCEYTFNSYGAKDVSATIRLANNKSYRIQGSITINEPLLLARHAQIIGRDGTTLSTEDTYDPVVRGYVIKNLILPQELTLNAQEVLSENPGYTMSNVTWRIYDTDGLVEEKI